MHGEALFAEIKRRFDEQEAKLDRMADMLEEYVEEQRERQEIVEYHVDEVELGTGAWD